MKAPDLTDAIIKFRSLDESLRSLDERYPPDQILIHETDWTARGEDPKAPSDIWAWKHKTNRSGAIGRPGSKWCPQLVMLMNRYEERTVPQDPRLLATRSDAILEKGILANDRLSGVPPKLGLSGIGQGKEQATALSLPRMMQTRGFLKPSQ